MKLVFERRISEKYSDIKLNENRSVRAELFHADGRTDMAKLIVAFRNFLQAPKMWKQAIVN